MSDKMAAMTTEDLTLTDPSNQHGLVVAALWRRAAAFVLNRFLIVLLYWLVFLNGRLWIGNNQPISFAGSVSESRLLFGWFLWSVFGLLLIQMGLMASCSQSIGKKIMGIRVVQKSGEPTDFGQALWSRYCIPWFIGALLMIVMRDALGVDNLFAVDHVFWMILLAWYGLLSLSILWPNNTQHRTWQDIVAKTVVVSVVKHQKKPST